jgi:hypothetical protein
MPECHLAPRQMDLMLKWSQGTINKPCLQYVQRTSLS